MTGAACAAWTSTSAATPCQLATLVAMVDAGELRVDVGERIPLAQLPAVHAQAVGGGLPGKVVLRRLLPRSVGGRGAREPGVRGPWFYTWFRAERN